MVASGSDWLIALFVSVVIGQNDYFGFGFTVSIETAVASQDSDWVPTERDFINS